MPATQVDVIMGIQGLSQMFNKALAPYDAESTASRLENSDLFKLGAPLTLRVN